MQREWLPSVFQCWKVGEVNDKVFVGLLQEASEAWIQKYCFQEALLQETDMTLRLTICRTYLD